MDSDLTSLFYIPNSVEPGHRGDDTIDGWGTLEYSAALARTGEEHGWGGALLGTGWTRPDTFTVATALAVLTSRFKPLAAIRPGYWHPAHFASAAATLDQLTGGRLLINIVSGADDQAAYGDHLEDSARRYDRTREFIELMRRLWTEENVDFAGEYYSVTSASLNVRPAGFTAGSHPPIYFGGASPAAERVAAAEADIQLFWGEPLDDVAERIDRLRALGDEVDRKHPPLEFGLRVTTLVRDTADEAWRDAEEKVAMMAVRAGSDQLSSGARRGAVGQQRLLALAERGHVLDTCLYTAPGELGGGGAGTTWLVGSATDVAQALAKLLPAGDTALRAVRHAVSQRGRTPRRPAAASSAGDDRAGQSAGCQRRLSAGVVISTELV